MSARLDRIAAEREKARRKRDEWDERFKELDRKYTEQENTEIHEMVRARSLTPDQLAALLRDAEKAAPNPAGLDAVMGKTDGNGADTDAAMENQKEDTENE